MRPLPVLLISLCLAISSSAQKCRLRKSSWPLMVQNPESPGAGPAPTSTASPGGSASPTASSPTSSATQQLFNYSRTKVRGVNLGGWLVLEPWITPSLFDETGNDDIIDEYTFGQLQDREVALARLQRHWDTWITEDDFRQIAEAGLNHVRLPVGYWAVPMPNNTIDPYIPGQWPYVLKAIEWADKYNIEVLFDLHGARGSQNGYDNSGQRTDSPQWALDSSHVAHTVEILRFIAREVGHRVSMIDLLNEPAGFREGWPEVIRDFWTSAYAAVRGEVNSDTKLMISDAFIGVANWNGFLVPPDGQGVSMGVHGYQIFSEGELARSRDEHLDFACNRIPGFRDYSASNLWTILSEWSAATTDCAKYLNGRGRGARWEGELGSRRFGSCEGYTGSASTFSDDYKDWLSRYFQVQVEIGEAVQGWVYWTWKAEEADEWSYQSGLANGWIPRDPSQRLHPNICN